MIYTLFYENPCVIPKKVLPLQQFLINESNYSLCQHDFGSIPYIFAKLNSEAINAQGNKREAIKVYVGNELAAIAEPIDYS